ncbi:hypothetical protein ACWIG5_39300, partial [Streptomyces lydicus]
LEERADRARERETARAARDDLARRRDVPELSGDAFDRRVLDLYQEARTRTVRVPGNLDSPGRVVHEQVAGPERELREQAIRSLQQSVREFNRLDQLVTGIDARLNELQRQGVDRDRPLSDDVVAELDQLAGRQAAIFQESRRPRAVLEDLAERLSIPLTDLGPEPQRLADTIDHHLRTDDGTDPDRPAMLDVLATAAADVIRADNAMTRLQDQMTALTERWHEVAGWRDTLTAEGGRMVTDQVGYFGGERPRIVVFGPVSTSDQPRAGHDAALEHAIRTNSDVAQGMMRSPQIEYRHTAPGRETVVSRGPEVERLETGWINGDPGLLMVRWRDSDGVWHAVNPSRPDWKTNRDTETPDAYDPGDPDWWAGLADYINDLATPFADIPPGHIAKNMLPMNPMNVPVLYDGLGVDPDSIETIHLGGDIYAIQRNLRTLFAAIDHPMVRDWIHRHPEIGDWVKARPWLQKMPIFGTVWSSFDWYKPPESNIQP